jgi:hypothetical protein
MPGNRPAVDVEGVGTADGVDEAGEVAEVVVAGAPEDVPPIMELRAAKNPSVI